MWGGVENELIGQKDATESNLSRSLVLNNNLSLACRAIRISYYTVTHSHVTKLYGPWRKTFVAPVASREARAQQYFLFFFRVM
jgi:hypothetical protein